MPSASSLHKVTDLGVFNALFTTDIMMDRGSCGCLYSLKSDSIRQCISCESSHLAEVICFVKSEVHFNRPPVSLMYFSSFIS